MERGGLGCFQTATRFACRTTFRCAHFALASKLARSLLSESTPNNKERIARCVFFLCGAGWIWRFFENRHTLRVSNHLSVLTLGQFAQVQPCAIKRIHPPRKSVLFCTVFLFLKNLCRLAGFSWYYRAPILALKTSTDKTQSHNFAISLAWC